MDFLRINASKLKITLSAAECEEYNIKENDGEFDSAVVREVIGELLEEVGADDFHAGAGKLLVQLYPTAGGGAELFVTKLSSVGEKERRAVAKAENLSTYNKNEAHFVFKDLKTLISACRALAGKNKTSALYLKADGTYLLTVIENRLNGLSDCDILTEFATRLQNPEKNFSPEWYKLLRRPDAIDTLAAL